MTIDIFYDNDYLLYLQAYFYPLRLNCNNSKYLNYLYRVSKFNNLITFLCDRKYFIDKKRFV